MGDVYDEIEDQSATARPLADIARERGFTPAWSTRWIARSRSDR